MTANLPQEKPTNKTKDEVNSDVTKEKKDMDEIGVPEKKKYDHVVVEEHQYGVWKVFLCDKPQETVSDRVRRRFLLDHSGLSPSLIARFYMDVYSLSPVLFLAMTGSWFWESLESAITMYLTNDMLRAIEAGLAQNKPVVWAVIKALASRALCSGLLSYISSQRYKLELQMREKVNHHFSLEMMQATLRNLEISPSPDGDVEYEEEELWNAFLSLHCGLGNLFAAVLELFVILKSTNIPYSYIFLILHFVHSFLRDFLGTFRRSRECMSYSWINNTGYVRVKALESLVSSYYRQDVICGDLADWILDELKGAWAKLEILPTGFPWHFFEGGVGPLGDMLKTMLDDGPMALCLVMAVLGSAESLSMANIAILHTSLSTLRRTTSRFDGNLGTIRHYTMAIFGMYEIVDANRQERPPKTPYPSYPSEKCKGMEFKFVDLCFSYLGRQGSVNALQDINLTIPAGSVVVVVGENGSGKSTLIKILSCLNTPTTGSFLIDGKPADEYEPHDLRQASVILSQDSQLYPLSFAENIGLGCVNLKSDASLVQEAAEKGGAMEFISKLEAGLDTVLDPLEFASPRKDRIPDDDDHPLTKIVNNSPKSIDISGGERQKLLAARAFMRLHSGKVNFIAVDEPSSALDAAAELHLFNGLLAAREGKTVVFVTHRFGHLTKYADMILCMKEGRIVESGTHSELIQKADGEYARLYRIQADAFSE
ncbi:multidrug resistance protein 1 [Coprinopsis cinerea AmutBmut pab1-1]|nr:multidrug resistance protein 1 [Coprinopsis cinerea AmutBmut pab1-1]